MENEVHFLVTIYCTIAVRFKNSMIESHWQESLNKYLTVKMELMDLEPIAIGGMHDHLHLLYGLSPNISVEDSVNLIKMQSSQWVNEQGFNENPFAWQEGYGAFTISTKDRPEYISYIQNQDVFHITQSFKSEFIGILNHFGVEYNESDLFNFDLED